jgi:hypothetical protein
MSAHQEHSTNKGRCIKRPKPIPLTEQSLLELEQSQQGYRRLERLLDHWFFYLQDTTANIFSTYIGTPDCDFHPPSNKEEGSILSLSQADFQESHVSSPSSVDLFGLTARSPSPRAQVVIQVPRAPSNTPQETQSSPHSTSTATISTIAVASPPRTNPLRLRQRLSPVRIVIRGKSYTGFGIPHWTVDSLESSPADLTQSESTDHLDDRPDTRLSPISISSDPDWSVVSPSDTD